VLIVCEGSKDEPEYFEDLKQELRASGVHIPRSGSSPTSVVETAIREVRRAAEAGEPYDHAWCVFDRDTHADFQEACQVANGNRIHLAVSVPSFEVWLLLHFRYSTAPLGSAEKAKKQLKAMRLAYPKNVAPWRELRPKAVEHGRKLIKHHGRVGSRLTDPWTDVHLLIELLRSLRARV
jgi:hypothetical protein